MSLQAQVYNHKFNSKYIQRDTTWKLVRNFVHSEFVWMKRKRSFSDWIRQGSMQWNFHINFVFSSTKRRKQWIHTENIIKCSFNIQISFWRLFVYFVPFAFFFSLSLSALNWTVILVCKLCFFTAYFLSKRTSVVFFHFTLLLKIHSSV